MLRNMRLNIVINTCIAISITLFGFTACNKDGNDTKHSDLNIEERQNLPLDIEKIQKLEIGDSYAVVIAMLGEPSYDTIMTRKEDNSVVGRRLLYIYQQNNPLNFNQSKDRYLSLWFDTKDVLIEIDPRNISQLHKKYKIES
ncbi:hypothetical protein [Gynuella sunshinyii]|uniref:hypothetical protein n=1 Tax=Gynuella sunshinyii TaxID=1445505 RepID=UPI0005CBFAF0|nr:hypothetical protein [Gynuella sunshinyii]